ncbi:putative transcriptional regulator [Actinacidiphila reveromycinica]|uniref:Putative transcriptional regulator n=1 Tax=Actinacidiphila reveromycinica TaxID=659352 RepID=A0A7U3URA0_9ACTN|nr:helix-turn-helix domain-containing protein [Streptomyces sp. SN-593]BBA97297.1 putative transcriptional regulator [Streptomyces sp. SN-593]
MGPGGGAEPVGPAQACPIAPVVDIVFSRWTTPILWALHAHGRQRFVELQRLIGTITPKVLTQRLRQMERDGLVVRTYHPEVPPRVEYEISDLGSSLAPLFSTLAEWSEANLGRVEQARRTFDDAAAGTPAPGPGAPRPRPDRRG